MLDFVPTPPPESTPDFEAFRREAYKLSGLDLTSYKVPQMHRRLSVLLTKVGVRNFAEYAKLIAQDPQRRQEFRDFVTINVSEFFRDGDRFGDLEKRLQGLMGPGGALKAWSAGCSIGAEPYSLAIMLLEMAPGRPHSIVATDIDETILARARSASDYLPADIRNVGKERMERWFTLDGNGRHTLKPAPRALVSFKQHDLLKDRAPLGAPFDLVCCRNVVIYFTEAAKDRIYAGFVDALRPGGLLFIGATEAIMQPTPLGLQVVGPGFYQKVDQVMARAA
ncbi:MAG TPA: protein-glutamate O-methyltransferase CheR [Chloroflexota bacterium]|nr:protein-glutamate O-methyltransferase CheR [Chloroflexota bacterium]